MKRKKFLSTLFASALAVSMLAGYGNVTTFASDNAAATEAADSTAETTDETADNEEDAEQLMKDLTGTYQELWPVILDDQYKQLWLDDCKELVGEENAEGAYEKLASMVSGKIYGEEAVKEYADGNGVYDCEFTQDVDTLEFDGDTSTIKGYDADKKELFSHTYRSTMNQSETGMTDIGLEM